MKIFGVHPIEELLATAHEFVRYVACARWDAAEMSEVRRLCEQHGVSQKTVSREQLDVWSEGNKHQGVIAELTEFRFSDLERVVEATADAATACVLVLDQVQDPQNLGAIIRTAAGMGADAVIIPKDRAAGITPTVVRSSAGLVFRVPIVQVTNVSRALEELKSHGFWVVGTFMDGEKTPWEMDLRMKSAIVMGGEHKGIRQLVERNCDFRVRIPLREGAESLNVGVAAAVLLYEYRRQNT